MIALDPHHFNPRKKERKKLNEKRNQTKKKREENTRNEPRTTKYERDRKWWKWKENRIKKLGSLHLKSTLWAKNQSKSKKKKSYYCSYVTTDAYVDGFMKTNQNSCTQCSHKQYHFWSEDIRKEAKIHFLAFGFLSFLFFIDITRYHRSLEMNFLIFLSFFHSQSSSFFMCLLVPCYSFSCRVLILQSAFAWSAVTCLFHH